MGKYVSAMVSHPGEPKYNAINAANKSFTNKLGQFPSTEARPKPRPGLSAAPALNAIGQTPGGSVAALRGVKRSLRHTAGGKLLTPSAKRLLALLRRYGELSAACGTRQEESAP